MRYPQSIQELIDFLSELPSVGQKTAERYVFYFLKQSPERLKEIGQIIIKLKKGIKICERCGVISETTFCPICQDANRKKDLLCIVANTRDLISLENTKQYQGLYFVLGGVINTIEGLGPEKLNITKLMDRIKEKEIKEVILAFSPNLEGETTVLYLSNLLKAYPIKISKLARGLSAGSSLEYADDNTLSQALKYRNEVK
jgi:recombination protein RecR